MLLSHLESCIFVREEFKSKWRLYKFSQAIWLNLFNNDFETKSYKLKAHGHKGFRWSLTKITNKFVFLIAWQMFTM